MGWEGATSSWFRGLKGQGLEKSPRPITTMSYRPKALCCV